MEVDGTLLTILGVAAGILILSGWVEQIIKGYKTKSLKDVSKYLMILISGGAILWLIYGVVVSDVFIIGTNVAAVFLMMTVLFMKKRYEKTSKINQ
jgi:MtN3 and saliva related transmembrane protein